MYLLKEAKKKKKQVMFFILFYYNDYYYYLAWKKEKTKKRLYKEIKLKDIRRNIIFTHEHNRGKSQD